MVAYLVRALLIVVLMPLLAVYGKDEKGDCRIAVVDLKMVQQESLAMKSLKVQAEKLRGTYQEEVANLEDQLKKGSSSSGSKSYSPEEAWDEEKLEKKYKKLYELSRVRKAQWEIAVRNANYVFTTKVNSIIQKIAEEKGYLIVLNKETLPHSQPSLEITKSVIETLNKEMPSAELITVSEQQALDEINGE